MAKDRPTIIPHPLLSADDLDVPEVPATEEPPAAADPPLAMEEPPPAMEEPPPAMEEPPPSREEPVAPNLFADIDAALAMAREARGVATPDGPPRTGATDRALRTAKAEAELRKLKRAAGRED